VLVRTSPRSRTLELKTKMGNISASRERDQALEAAGRFRTRGTACYLDSARAYWRTARGRPTSSGISVCWK